MIQVKTLILSALVLACLLANPCLANQITAEGEWSSERARGLGGKWRAVLLLTEETVEGTVDVGGSNLLRRCSVTGSLDNGNLVLGLVSDTGNEATFSGRLAVDTIDGEWTMDALGDHGVWSGTVTTNDGN